MFTSTFRLAREAGACATSYRRFAKHVGGIKKYGENTPIPLIEVLEVIGLYDALWCLGCTQQPDEAERAGRLLAADFAEHVLHIFEKSYPDDKRPREAIEVARQYARGEVGAAAWAAARDAARDAAGAAAGAAAGDAARDAAGAAAWAAAWAAAGAAAGAAARAAARDAAWDAAWAAARAAAGAAARDAARAAEREWQVQKFKEVVNP